MGAEHAAGAAMEPALARAAGVNKRYIQRAPFSRRKFVIQALQDVELAIQPGSVTALAGESGSGKSTLASCLAALDRPDSGEIWFEGNEISHWTTRQLAPLRSRIQMVFQDSAGALNPRFSAAQVIEEPLEIQRLTSGAKSRTRACALMQEVGLSPDWADRSPLQLSGGQRQRLAIARAIALRPSLLILDESLSGLDLITQHEILRLLRDLQARHSLTYVLISHDLSLLAQIADYIAIIHRGRIVEQGSMRQILERPESDYTRELLGFACALESSWQRAQAGGQL